MKTIAILKGRDAEGNETIAPAEPFPANAIAIICDGEKYTVYEPGDELPPVTETTEPA